MNERMNIEDCDCENCTTFNRTQIRIARAQPHSSWEFSQIDRLGMKMKKVKKKSGKRLMGGRKSKTKKVPKQKCVANEN